MELDGDQAWHVTIGEVVFIKANQAQRISNRQKTETMTQYTHHKGTKGTKMDIIRFTQICKSQTKRE